MLTPQTRVMMSPSLLEEDSESTRIFKNLKTYFNRLFSLSSSYIKKETRLGMLPCLLKWVSFFKETALLLTLTGKK